MERWWNVDAEQDKGSATSKLAGSVFAVVEHIDREFGEDRRKRNLQHVGLYENRNLPSLPIDGITIPVGIQAGDLTLNVVSSCIDSLASKIATNKPKPMYVTVDGDFSQQMAAKRKQRFIMGCLLGSQAYKKSIDVFLDAGKCDIGALKVIPGKLRNGKRTVDYERVFPNELVVDEKAAQRGEPREMFQKKFVATDVMIAQFPDYEEQIKRSSSPKAGDTPIAMGLIEDRVEVIEAWKLPSGDDSDDGRHCICVRHAALLDEKWKDQSFPFAFLRWTKLSQGFYGQGLAEQLHGIQQEITEIVQKLQKGHRLLGIPWVYRPTGCIVREGSITNAIGEYIDFEGPQPPKVEVHAIFAPEVYQYLQNLFEKAFEVSGISQLSATSHHPPPGVESGVALRTLLSVETQRFALLVDYWQEYFLELARQTENCARRMGGASSIWRHKEWSREVEYETSDDSPFELQLWPVNLLPDEPAGRLAYIEQMITMGLLTPEQGQGLLDFPDLEAFQRTASAARELVEMIIEEILVNENYIPPSRFMNLALSVDVMQGAILRGQINGWPEEKLAPLAKWIDEAIALQQPPEMQPGPGPLAAPPNPQLAAWPAAAPPMGPAGPMPPEMAPGEPPPMGPPPI